jgi:hypothetical protein
VPMGGAATDGHLGEEGVAQPPVASATWAASDFWGEDAAHVQDALHAPVQASGAEARPERERQPDPPRPSKARRLSWPPIARALRAHAPSWRRASVGCPRPAVAAALAGSVAAVLIAFTVSVALSGASGARPARNTPAATGAHNVSFADPGKQLNRLVAMLAPTRIPPLAQRRRGHAAKSASAKRRVAMAQPRTSRVHAVSPSHAQAASPSPAATSASSNAPPPSKPAGPSGAVSLLGAGTSPSG